MDTAVQVAMATGVWSAVVAIIGVAGAYFVRDQRRHSNGDAPAKSKDIHALGNQLERAITQGNQALADKLERAIQERKEDDHARELRDIQRQVRRD